MFWVVYFFVALIFLWDYYNHTSDHYLDRPICRAVAGCIVMFFWPFVFVFILYLCFQKERGQWKRSNRR